MRRKIKNKTYLITAILLAAFSWSLLPNEVIMQVDSDGNPVSTMTKTMAIFMSLALTLAGSLMDDCKKDAKDRRGAIIAIGGIVCMVVVLVTNLFVY